jgi:hypothetical protein
MTRLKWTSITAVALAIMLGDLPASIAPVGSFVTDAQAKVGRPGTPYSVAGAARRTTRRVVRRSTIYVNTLPKGCVRTNVGGVVVWRCGSTYYQPYGGTRYVVVYID